jgi:hypothetical protein
LTGKSAAGAVDQRAVCRVTLVLEFKLRLLCVELADAHLQLD